MSEINDDCNNSLETREEKQHRAPGSPPAQWMPDISRAGICISFPPVKIDHYLDCLAVEADIKSDLLMHSQPVSHIRFQGSPFIHFTAEELTELLYRVNRSFNLSDSTGERQTDLKLEQCSADNLALLRGLGFNQVRLLVDTCGGIDTNPHLEQIIKATSLVYCFSGLKLSAGIRFDHTTSPRYLKKLTAYLYDNFDSDITFYGRDGNRNSSEDASLACRRTFTSITAFLVDLGYRLIGDKSFKPANDPDLKLLNDRKLEIGPWGFFNTSTRNWLGLGPGSPGLIGGNLYHNFASFEDYHSSIRRGKSPICCWSGVSMYQRPCYNALQRLYLEHRTTPLAHNGRTCSACNLPSRIIPAIPDREGNLTIDDIYNLPAIKTLYANMQGCIKD